MFIFDDLYHYLGILAAPLLPQFSLLQNTDFNQYLQAASCPVAVNLAASIVWILESEISSYFTPFSDGLKLCVHPRPFGNAFKPHDFSFHQQPSLSRQIQSRQQQQHHQTGACGGEGIA